MPAITSFRLAVPDAELEDLHERLERTRWPDALPDDGWERGVPLAYLRELAEHWRSGYDWRAHEARLNELPQFTTAVDGIDLHFAHVRSPEPDARPLLLGHGWPGTFAEFAAIAGPLTDPAAHGGDAADAVELVIPSIPGYPLSSAPREPGFAAARFAQVYAELMTRLGHQRFWVHAGDWGAAIARELGLLAPERVAGLHLSYFQHGSVGADPESDDPGERRSAELAAQYHQRLAGYAIVQSTQPQTLAYALTDSPVGQLAWLAQCYAVWSGAGGVDRDDLLTTASLYWFGRAAGSSANSYWEAAQTGAWGAQPERATVPTGVLVLPEDMGRPVRRIVASTDHVVRWTELEAGGHFPALEVPDALVAEIRAFLRQVS